MQSHLEEFRKANATVLAISSDDEEAVQETARDRGIAFPLLADPRLATIGPWGLRHAGARVDGGDASRPAIFLIDGEGRIRRRLLTENWRVRERPEDLVKALAALR